MAPVTTKTGKFRAAGPRRPRTGPGSLWAQRKVKIGVAAALIALTIGFGLFAFYYHRYEVIVDRRMRGQIFANAAKIYGHPAELHPGEALSAHEIIATLRRAGYSQDSESEAKIGTYRTIRNGLEIQPGANSYHSAEGAMVTEEAGKIARINALSDGHELGAYELEPELITALFEGEQRSKRRLIRYEDLSKNMVDAVLGIEDRRFFQHSGVNYYRMMEAAWVDFRAGKYEQGGSTLTMQVARGFFLSPEKNTKRKLTEMLISLILEQKFTKRQIFELYANQVYMGQRGSFTISGLGEAAEAYFGKDVKNLTLPEAALLAGMIQRPNFYSPYKSPERALERRNLVLDAMVEIGSIKRDEADKSKATPLRLAPPNEEASEAPYFVDLVKDTLFSKYNEQQVNGGAYRIYTTLDPDLQRAAAEAVDNGIKDVDTLVRHLRTHTVVVGRGKAAKKEIEVKAGPMPQVALIAIDPHTGAVLALVGGRNYGMSQLDHAVSKRPTGSIFKPFVYAAAMNTAIAGEPSADQNPAPLNPGNPAAAVFTPATMIDDSPTTFSYGDQIYEPRNYKEEYHGPVTARYALAMSLNNATVKLAEQVGYDKVADLAKAAGIKSVQATPAMALGSYDATPLDMAGAYTIFANNGVKVSPIFISSLRDAQGNVIENFDATRHEVLDPRVAYVMTDMMQGVLNFGLGYQVRRAGFTAPAAGKTGSSHDAWFEGYTSNLLCIVWVGYDDYSDIRLSGAQAAAPIWAAFMKHAATLPAYHEMQPFTPPAGVQQVVLDKVTNRLATPACPDDYSAVFVEGTAPRDTCDQSGTGGVVGFFSRIFGGGAKPSPPPVVSNPAQPGKVQPAPTIAQQQQQQQQAQPAKKKKGFWSRIFGGDDDKKDENNSSQEPPPKPPQE